MITSVDMLQAATRVIQRDGILLDERRWNEWLELYLPECRFSMPLWKNEEELNADGASSLSHMYYENRKGLEDRIVRIRSGKSPASSPLPRTAHTVSNIEAEEGGIPGTIASRATFACYVFFTRARVQHVFFGRSSYVLAPSDGVWRIQEKKVVLLNDNIPGVLDLYCV